MIVALMDNGSLEAGAHLNLRRVAEAMSAATGVPIEAVSWKHSDRVAAAALGGRNAWTLAPWIRAQLARGEREFVIVPFFISAQGAIGSALRGDLEKLQRETATNGGFQFTFSEGLAGRNAIPPVIAARVREVLSTAPVRKPSVVIVDHGGPSAASAALRDSLAAQVRPILGEEIGVLVAASMEGSFPPLLADQLALPAFDRGDVVVAPLFLSPGRHAGPDGDIAQICRAAEAQLPNLRCHLTGLIGTHADIIQPLALALRETLATFQLPSPA